jgi:cytoskeletal protein CcmA (bactofilin family)
VNVTGIKAEEGVTVLGRGASFRGELSASGEVVIDGAMDGLVNVEGARLTIGKDARVHADINAQEVIVMGRLEGNIRASERVELRAGALVTGDVYAKRFAIEQEASFRGRVDPSRGGEPAAAEMAATQSVAEAKPRLEAAPGRVESQHETMGLFGGGARPTGKMPAGLAAAARTLGSSATPAGINALSDDGASSFGDEPEANV